MKVNNSLPIILVVITNLSVVIVFIYMFVYYHIEFLDLSFFEAIIPAIYGIVCYSVSLVFRLIGNRISE